MNLAKCLFLDVNASRAVSIRAATLLAYLKSRSKKQKKEQGYFELPTKRICKSLTLRRDSLITLRNQLKNDGYIDFQRGNWGSHKFPRYKILK